ncbi:methyltransferase [Candidatus Woesearchaeota archaeon]|nr:methyltransferase [Candidatus Woesearchaeota archaeon]
MAVYEPAEDSFLLQKLVKEHAFGRVLDMGSGSGIQAFAAAASPRVREVLAVDIDQEALAQLRQKIAKEKIAAKKIKTLQSDLFEHIAGKFDTIIFNPPYLPQDPGIEDHAIYGGKKGWELAERFFSQAGNYLTSKGKILFLFSSLTNKEKIDEIISHQLFTFQERGRHKLAFEELLVYSIEKSPILRELERRGIEAVHYFTHGKRGDIFVGMLNRNTPVKTHIPEKQLVKVAIKVQRKESQASARMANEAYWLERVNRVGIGPRFLFSGEEYVAYAFVEGAFFEEWIRQQASKKAIQEALRGILKQCHRLDQLGITKEELHHPVKHIIIDSLQQPVLLDFERAKETKKPQNITQFVEYLCRLEKLLREKKILLDKEKLRAAAKIYKASLASPAAEEAFNSLLACVE